jgi:hypothetical protein
LHLRSGCSDLAETLQWEATTSQEASYDRESAGFGCQYILSDLMGSFNTATLAIGDDVDGSNIALEF